MTTPAAADADAKRRWVNWTCLSCDHPFRTRTRRGLFLTCPRCGEVQRGPEGVRRALAELGRLKRGTRKAAAAGDAERTVRV